MAIKIVTDSTCDISSAEAEALGIHILPLRVRFGEKEYFDGVTLSSQEFYEKLSACEELPQTSQIPPEEFSNFFARETVDGDEVIGIFISSELSGTSQSARIGADDMPGVYLVDSLHVTFALGALVRIAVALRDQGKTASDIVEEIENVKHRLVLSAVVEDISYLVKGGRLSTAGGALVSALNIKPLIGSKEGKIVSTGVARGMKKGYQTIIQRMHRDGIDPDYPIIFGHTNSPQGAQALRELAVKFGFEVSDIPLQLIGCVVGTHAGPGAAGVVYVKK